MVLLNFKKQTLAVNLATLYACSTVTPEGQYILPKDRARLTGQAINNRLVEKMLSQPAVYAWVIKIPNLPELIYIGETVNAVTRTLGSEFALLETNNFIQNVQMQTFYNLARLDPNAQIAIIILDAGPHLAPVNGKKKHSEANSQHTLKGLKKVQSPLLKTGC